jgi:phosphatidylserine/phosphatidylglycerophosphate/cardiolipin synthase-like enzyme
MNLKIICTAKLILLLVLISLNTVNVFGQLNSEIILTESIPLETSLEKSGLQRTYDVWLKMINEAKETIDIETFYFANQKGQPLEDIINSVKSAAGRGVKIRIIVDSGFYSNSDKSIDELTGTGNIEIKKIPLSNLAGGVMHAKYFIVDNNTVFLGSQNMDWRALIHIHEIGIAINSSELARTFHELFETDWKLCDNNMYGLANMAVNYFVNAENPVVLNSGQYGKVTVYPAFSPPKLNMAGLSQEEDEILKVINQSKIKLCIQMYSYSPKAKNEKNYYDKIDNALREAAGRGVEIKIIFSDWAIKDAATDFIKNLSSVKNIKIKFSSIPEYSGGFIPYARVEHCKYFISDNNLSVISTSNWEWSYFNNSRNVTLFIENENINKELENVFYRSWDSEFVSDVDINKEYKPVKRN